MNLATAEALRAAAATHRTNGDAARAETCESMAHRIDSGHTLTEKANSYALSLITRATSPAAPTDWGRDTPKLQAAMLRLSHLHVDPFKLSRKNGTALVWVMYDGLCVGKIENARTQVWTGRCAKAGTAPLAVLAIIEEFEADPLEAAKRYGKASGRCCACGRDLTDPVSIEQGIGPVCAKRLS